MTAWRRLKRAMREGNDAAEGMIVALGTADEVAEVERAHARLIAAMDQFQAAAEDHDRRTTRNNVLLYWFGVGLNAALAAFNVYVGAWLALIVNVVCITAITWQRHHYRRKREQWRGEREAIYRGDT